MNKPFIIGVGNSARSDDGVGEYVVSALKSAGFDGVALDIDGTRLLDYFAMHDDIIIVDAINHTSVALGEFLEFDALQKEIPLQLFHYSSHLIGVAEGIKLAKELGTLPKTLKVYGLGGNNFNYGFELDAKLQQAADLLILKIKSECMK